MTLPLIGHLKSIFTASHAAVSSRAASPQRRSSQETLSLHGLLAEEIEFGIALQLARAAIAFGKDARDPNRGDARGLFHQ